MKFFISSVIKGFSQYRQAAAEAIRTFDHEPVMAEDFPAEPSTPQRACLRGVRESDAMVLILGKRYGAIQSTGLSATHEEYNEAREQIPVFVFIERGDDYEDNQRQFITAVGDWNSGYFGDYFTSPAELQRLVARAINKSVERTQLTTADRDALLDRASSLAGCQSEEGYLYRTTDTTLSVALIGHPTRQIISSTELESVRLQESIEQAAIYGEHRLFERHIGTVPTVRLDEIEIVQNDASILVTEAASIRIRVDALRSTRSDQFMMSSMIEEDICEDICRSLLFADELLESVDTDRQFQNIAVGATVVGAIDHVPWTNRAAYNPHSVTLPMRRNDGLTPAALVVPRSTLRHRATSYAEELTVKLRRSLASIDGF